MTAKQLEWLQHLTNGPSRREGWHTVPFSCCRQGWTAVSYSKDGEYQGDELTPKGREKLKEKKA
jgi:hypothetical protein